MFRWLQPIEALLFRCQFWRVQEVLFVCVHVIQETKDPKGDPAICAVILFSNLLMGNGTFPPFAPKYRQNTARASIPVLI